MWSWNKRVTPKFKIIEVEKPSGKLPQMSPDVKAAIETLAHHPGFTYLMDRFKMQRGVLQHHLVNNRHESIRDVEFLQSGIAWLGWLEKQLNQTIYKMQDTANPATDIEAEMIAAVEHAIETVGQD